MSSTRVSRGFTLIEVMIVVAIIAILAAIAYPAYTEQVARSRRANAKTALLEAAQWMERHYTISNNYTKMGDGTTTINTAAIQAANLQANQSIADFYTLSFSVGPATSTFTLAATPRGPMAGDRCGAFTVDNTGARDRTGSGATVAECWNK